MHLRGEVLGYSSSLKIILYIYIYILYIIYITTWASNLPLTNSIIAELWIIFSNKELVDR